MADFGMNVDLGTGASALSVFQTELAQELKRLLRDKQWHVYAILDGAQFDDLPAALKIANIAHRSLYINVDDEELIDAGPWLIDFYHEPNSHADVSVPTNKADEADLSDHALTTRAEHLADQMRADLDAGLNPFAPAAPVESVVVTNLGEHVDALLAVVGKLPAAVFWVGDSHLTEEMLWKHARSINRVMIPRYFADFDKASDNDADALVDVMFRHGDGNVLAEVLPTLTASQYARLFGPALGLMFIAPDHPAPNGSPLFRVPLPIDGPRAQAGFLTFTFSQMEEIENIRLGPSRSETMAYLRENAAEETAHLSNAQLNEVVSKIETRGFALGFESMTAHLLFAYMATTGCAGAIESEEFSEFVEKSGKHPDDAINGVFDGMINAAEADVRGPL